MNSLLDKYCNLNIENIVVNQPSFKRIIADGIITEEEIEEQSQQMVAKIKEIESIATPEVKENMRVLLLELVSWLPFQTLETSRFPKNRSITVRMWSRVPQA